MGQSGPLFKFISFLFKQFFNKTVDVCWFLTRIVREHPDHLTTTTTAPVSVFNGPFPASLFSIFIFSTFNYKFVHNFADDWIWTMHLRYQKQLLCQLSRIHNHGHCPNPSFYVCTTYDGIGSEHLFVVVSAICKERTDPQKDLILIQILQPTSNICGKNSINWKGRTNSVVLLRKHLLWIFCFNIQRIICYEWVIINRVTAGHAGEQQSC